MRKITIAGAVLAIALGAGTASAALTIVGSPHDLYNRTTPFYTSGGQICLPCHVPHNGINTSTYQPAPIWNHNLTTAQFKRNGANITLTGTSLLCMSCHDGVTAIGNFKVVPPTVVIADNTVTMANLPGASALNSLGSDLSATHPVSVAYGNLTATDSSRWHSTGTKYGAPAVGGKLLLEDDGTGVIQNVGCGTCHTPHDNTQGKFLAISNLGSALCLTCHVK